MFDPTAPLPSPDRARCVGRAIVFLWFLIGGIAHFVATDTEVRLVPPYVPWPLAAVWVSGVFELLGAGGLLFAGTRRAAGIGLFALTLCVTPVKIYMLQRPELFAVPYGALVLRLPIQVALLSLIAWSSFSKACSVRSLQWWLSICGTTSNRYSGCLAFLLLRRQSDVVMRSPQPGAKTLAPLRGRFHGE